MRIRNLLPAVAAVAIVTGPAFAQDVPAENPAPPAPATDATASASLTAEQQSQYDTWPPAQQAQYDAWPADTQTYFWSLTGDRQELFWRLADSDKVALAGLPLEQQDQVWAQIESQAAATPAAPAGEPDVEDDAVSDGPM